MNKTLEQHSQKLAEIENRLEHLERLSTERDAKYERLMMKLESLCKLLEKLNRKWAAE